VAHVMQSHPDLKLRVRGTVAVADVDRLREQAALAALAGAKGTDRVQSVLRARLAGTLPPSLDATQLARLEAALAAVPWPGDRLQQLAADRAATAAAALVVEHRVPTAHVVVDSTQIASPDDLAGAAGATVELREG